MQDLEDEPEDVQNATPVEDEVKRGEIDEIDEKKVYNAAKGREQRPRHYCKKDEPASQKDSCCELRRQSAASARQKTVTMYVHEEPCKLAKQRIIPRHCMSKEEYIDFLAAPKEKCKDTCAMKRTVRRLRPVPPRIMELARPPKRKLILTLEERAELLTPMMVDNLVEMLEEESALTPEQAEQQIRDKKKSKKLSKKKKKKRSKNRCLTSPPKPLCAGEPNIDWEAANCQYSMAQRFVRSIFSWSCSIPRSDYSDIFDVVLDRISQTLEYTPIGNEDRKSQQMRLLADAFSCWISGVLMQVAEKHKAELEEECERRRLEAEQLEALAQQEQELLEEEDEIAGSGDYEDDDDDDDDEEAKEKELEAAASLARTLLEESMKGTMQASEATLPVETATQYETEDAEGDESEMDAETLASLLAAKSKTTLAESEAETVPSEADETITELADVSLQATISAHDMYTEASAASVKSKEQLELERLASRLGACEPDIPFVNFARLLDTLYCMVQCEPENTLNDLTTNRIHRAVYLKFETAIKAEDPALLTPRTRDIVDVVAGKIATWLMNTLSASQIGFLADNPPCVESREVRDWAKWLNQVAEVAENWTGWIDKVADDATCMRREGHVTRGEWYNWTSKFESNALLWRRAYLEARHQGHHNTMMMLERRVEKTGGKKSGQNSEIAIKDTRFDSVSKM